MTAAVSPVGPAGRAVVAATVSVLPVFLAGGLVVQIGADLGFTAASLGTAPAAFFGTAALASPLAGRIAERLGARRAIRASTALTAVVLVVLPWVATSLPGLLAGLATTGAANALAQPATNLYLAETVAPGRQGTAYGVKQSAIPAAGLLAGLAVPALGLTVGWRWAFVLAGCAALSVALWPPGSTVRTRAATGPGAPDISTGILTALAVSAALAAACGATLGIFLVAGAVHNGWSEAGAGVLFAVASGVCVLLRLACGIVADRWMRADLGVVIAMIATGAAGYALLAVPAPAAFGIGAFGIGAFGIGAFGIGAFGIGAVVALGVGWGWAGLFILAVVRRSPTSPAQATAAVQIGTSLGAVGGPLLFGLVVETSGWATAWLCTGGLSLLAAGQLWAVQRRLRVGPRARRPVAAARS